MLAERTRSESPITALALGLAWSACAGELPVATPLVFDAPRVLDSPGISRVPELGPPVSRSRRIDQAAGPALLADLDRPAITIGRLEVPSCEASSPDEVCTRGLSLTALAVVNTARGEARGASFPGALYAGELKEGERAEVELTAELTGRDGLADELKCYTVVAHGGGSVMEVDAFIASRDDGELAVLGQDRFLGPSAVAGGRTGCISAPSGSKDIRAIVRVRAGHGPVVMGVYELFRSEAEEQ